ncbi:arginine decarboxylase [Paenibacillus eucommiae]|uniref:Arginine decarboxylase n=1 Tax=Paenibacillus eucommiae TaxID=1355755 RepID=A0ABS4IQE9_9BACL|nr:arginine decarboxylase [Paenibacillus eucommiae]
MAATSVHKLGGSLTQSSILNVKGNRVNISRIRTVMSMLTTTSTSYLLLASLDAARRQLALKGWELAEETIRLANHARIQINKIHGLYCFGEEICEAEGVADYDPTKLCIHLQDLGITGYEAELWLRQACNIEVELSDLSNILCLITLGDTELEVDQLVLAMQKMSGVFRERIAANQRISAITPVHSSPSVHVPAPLLASIPVPEVSRFVISPRDAFYAETKKIPFKQSQGCIITEFIYVYPPDIPILMPGQVISEEIIDFIVQHMEAGLPVKGPEDPSIHEVKVVLYQQKDESLKIRNSYVIPD